jgi:hypothetical protein
MKGGGGGKGQGRRAKQGKPAPPVTDDPRFAAMHSAPVSWVILMVLSREDSIVFFCG